jgi:hypothetical protein
VPLGTLIYNSRGKTVLEEAAHYHEQDRNLTQGVFTPGIGGVQQLDHMEKDTQIRASWTFVSREP